MLYFVASLGALFSKETAAVIPVVLVVYYFLFLRNNHTWTFIAPSAILWSIILTIWFILRSRALAGANVSSLTGLPVVLGNLRTFPEFYYYFFMPFKIGPMPAFSQVASIAGILIIIFFIAFALYSRRTNKRMFLFGTIWFVVFLAPSLWTKHYLGGYAFDYLTPRFYLPSVGLLIALMAMLPLQVMQKRLKWFIPALVIIIGCSIYSWSLASSYRDWHTFYDYAIENNSSSACALNNRGYHRLQEGNVAGAMTDLNHALIIYPAYRDAFMNMGNLYKNTHKYADALIYYSKSISCDSSFSLAYFNRGQIYQLLGMNREAVQDFCIALRFKPSMYQAYLCRALANDALDDRTDALQDFNEALRIKNDFAEAYESRGRILKAMKRFHEAESDLETAIKLNPKLHNAYIELSALRLEEGDKTTGMKYLNSAIAADPTSDEGYIARGIAKWKVKDYQGALYDFDNAIRIKPGSALAYSNKGNIHEEMKRLDLAEKDFSGSVLADPGFAIGYFNRGMIRFKLKDNIGACSDWSKALELGYTNAGEYLKRYCK